MTEVLGNTLVFDVGGTHVTGALVTDNSLALHAVGSILVDCHGTKDEILDMLEKLGREILVQWNLPPHRLEGLSFAMPGPFDYEAGTGHGQHKYEGLYGVNVRAELAKRFSIFPESITFINDAGAYLLGEIRGGVAKGGRRVIGITLGTGVGAAFAVDGRLLTSGRGVPEGGEIWNLPWEGGIVEDAISARMIQNLYFNLAGERMEVRQIAMRSTFDAAASNTMQQLGTNLGKVLRMLCSNFEPDTIVLGGAISRSARYFLPRMRAELTGIQVEIEETQLFDRAALIGAGAKWFDTRESLAFKRA